MNSSAAKRTPIGTISQACIEQQKADHLAEVAGVQAPKWHRNPISDISDHASCAMEVCVLRRCHEGATPPNLAIDKCAAISHEPRECSTAQAGRNRYFLWGTNHRPRPGSSNKRIWCGFARPILSLGVSARIGYMHSRQARWRMWLQCSGRRRSGCLR